MLKNNNTLDSCHNFPAGSRQAARGARICETSLLLSRYPIIIAAGTKLVPCRKGKSLRLI